MARRHRITVVSSGHLSTCPRMLKSADALASAGYGVHVVATSNEPWAIEADRDVRSRRDWPATIINYRKGHSGLTYWRSGLASRASLAVARRIGAGRTPLPLAARAVGRVHGELVRAIVAQPTDLVYGGTTGALAAVAEAAGRLGVAYGLDLEDFHTGETEGPAAPLRSALVRRIEDAVLHRATFLTTSSECIAAEYRQCFGVAPDVIHNTFPLPSRPPDFTRVDPDRLRVYWFSQTIGRGRGLEEAVAGLGRADVAAELTLRGRPDGDYVAEIAALAARLAPRVLVQHLPPAPPDAMVDLARGYDVGLALERNVPRNRALCMSNKAFTYLLAGLVVLLTDTEGQHTLGRTLGNAAAVVPSGDLDALAAIFAEWARNPEALAASKRAAWRQATERWHWEDDAERGTLYRVVREAFTTPTSGER